MKIDVTIDHGNKIVYAMWVQERLRMVSVGGVVDNQNKLSNWPAVLRQAKSSGMKLLEQGGRIRKYGLNPRLVWSLN